MVSKYQGGTRPSHVLGGVVSRIQALNPISWSLTCTDIEGISTPQPAPGRRGVINAKRSATCLVRWLATKISMGEGD